MMDQRGKFGSYHHHTRIVCNGTGRMCEERKWPTQELEDKKYLREKQKTRKLQRLTWVKHH